MSYYDDALTRAIQHKLMPGVMARWHDAHTIRLPTRTDHVELPLQADVSVGYDRGVAAFSVRGTYFDKTADRWLLGEGFFSTETIMQTRDKALVIEAVFENVKRSMIQELTEVELKRLLAG